MNPMYKSWRISSKNLRVNNELQNYDTWLKFWYHVNNNTLHNDTSLLSNISNHSNLKTLHMPRRLMAKPCELGDPTNTWHQTFRRCNFDKGKHEIYSGHCLVVIISSCCNVQANIRTSPYQHKNFHTLPHTSLQSHRDSAFQLFMLFNGHQIE